jgi:DNA-binding NarL/FixJ family response regulator
MRALIAHVLGAADIEVVAEATTAEETISLCRELRPDVVVLDQRMPPKTGIDIAETILADNPALVILLFTAFVDCEIRTEAARVGIAACVSKENVFEIPGLARAYFNPV